MIRLLAVEKFVRGGWIGGVQVEGGKAIRNFDSSFHGQPPILGRKEGRGEPIPCHFQNGLIFTFHQTIFVLLTRWSGRDINALVGEKCFNSPLDELGVEVRADSFTFTFDIY